MRAHIAVPASASAEEERFEHRTACIRGIAAGLRINEKIHVPNGMA